MKKLLVFIGDSGSGKTTLIHELVRRYPDKFRKIITSTSRSIRVGEIDGEDYDFLPESSFHSNSDLVLVNKTKTGDYYGTLKTKLIGLDEDDRHSMITLRQEGIGKLLAMKIEPIVVVRITISINLKVIRMRLRGDSEESIIERLKQDAENAVNVDPDLFTIELTAEQSLNEKVKQILEVCN